MRPCTKDAFRLLHRGSEALAIVEHTGLCIDTQHLESAITDIDHQIAELTEELKKDEVGEQWQKTFGSRTNYGSNQQLGTILFDKMGFAVTKHTKTGAPSTDAQALGGIDHPFVEKYLRCKTLEKMKNTYLLGIQRATVNGVLHPVFNLHTTQTYRSSASDPNFQNMPIRNKEMGSVIRKCFIPRSGHRLVEIDYSGIEVCIAACYHQDPTMLEYVSDKTKDMHRDMAGECYIVNPEDVPKDMRQATKGGFVFAQFYGNWYLDCAKNLWESAQSLKTKDGTPVIEHLKEQGIKELGALIADRDPLPGTFEYHIKQVEGRFWNERFPVYNQWKHDWYNLYRERGYLKTKTGFMCQGFMKRNEVINYPVQGSAFHCLLWSLTRIVLDKIEQLGMQSRVVGQIHDSIVADVPDNELHDYLVMANQVMCGELLDTWKWINVPIEVEADVTPVDGSWHLKETMTIPT